MSSTPPTGNLTMYPLQIEHLTKRYGHDVVLDDLTFTVAPARVTSQYVRPSFVLQGAVVRRATTQLSREYCSDKAVAVLSHPAYGSRTIPAHGTERATRPTSTQVSTAATARQSAAADSRCGT